MLAEGAFVTTAAHLPRITDPLAALARERRMDIVAGVIVTDAGHNTAVFFPARGGEPRIYRKRHMVPGVEPYEPGGRALVAGDVGVAICKDLDFPGLARENRRIGATVMFVPSWDFGLDAWQHSRIAVTRGVENGFAVVRGAADGNLTVSDPYGRVLAERATGDRAVVTLTAAVPAGGAGTPTPGGATGSPGPAWPRPSPSPGGRSRKARPPGAGTGPADGPAGRSPGRGTA
nr:hypothetical protein GCM10020093_108510 [Planobispora longispora]